ncbi:MAG TPA: pyridoxamine 5'-phosphate oxidase family protein [Beutenbergiaceae bacterium]|nr:pyridoxamine 5'-phosphate oxidase family protein [Beutenbergiaceae bacterium]
MALSPAEREEFLAEPHIGALAVHAGDGRGPLMVPIWYEYSPGGDLWVVTPAESRKAALIAQAGRFSLLVERTSPTVRYVTVEGPVSQNRPATEAEHEHMARRYLGDGADDYLTMAAGFGDVAYIAMTPQRWTSADMGGF